MQVVQNSSLVSVLFRESLSHPYISFFFHLVVNGFSVIIYYVLTGSPMYNMSYTGMCSSQFLNILRPIYYYNEHSVNTLYQISASVKNEVFTYSTLKFLRTHQ